MQLKYDEDFVEGAVFVCAGGSRKDISPLLIRRFHTEREELYAVLDADERSAAFFKLYLQWFQEWGMDKWLADLTKEFPLLSSSLTFLAFRTARRKTEEGAELYVNSDEARSGIVAIRVERFQKPEPLKAFLRHEMSHLHDMVDPDFGYIPQAIPGLTMSQQRLIRDRYRLLWSVSIEGRLSAKGYDTQFSRELRRTEFERAYGFWPEIKREDIFNRLWSATKPTHAWLMQLASDPRDLARSDQPSPGGLCPLCKFPTFEWTHLPTLSEGVRGKIEQEFTSWKIEQGACNRCVEMYQALAANELAGTVM